MKRDILVVNNGNGFYEKLLGNEHRVIKTDDEDEVLRNISRKKFNLLIIDLDLPSIKNLEILRMVRRLDTNIPVIMVSVVQAVEMAVEAMKSGSDNYLTKPIKEDELKSAINKLANQKLTPTKKETMDISTVIDEVKEDMLDRGATLEEAGEHFERKFLKVVLEKVNGDQARAASFLGIENEYLSDKLELLKY